MRPDKYDATATLKYLTEFKQSTKLSKMAHI